MSGIAPRGRGARAARRRPPCGRRDRVRREGENGQGAPALRLRRAHRDHLGAGEGRHEVTAWLVAVRGPGRRPHPCHLRAVGGPRPDARHAAARSRRGPGAQLPARRGGRGPQGASGIQLTRAFTSPLAEALAADVLDRFLRYARVDTQSARNRTGGSPSTPGQLDLSRMLVEELRDAGLADAQLDANGYVMATLAGQGAAIGLIAHVDTSPDAPGSGVEPIVHRAYD